MATTTEDDVEHGRPDLGPFPEVLDPALAAQFLGVSERVLLEATRRGEVPARKIGREWRYSRPGLHRWLTGEVEAPAVSAG